MTTEDRIKKYLDVNKGPHHPASIARQFNASVNLTSRTLKEAGYLPLGNGYWMSKNGT